MLAARRLACAVLVALWAAAGCGGTRSPARSPAPARPAPTSPAPAQPAPTSPAPARPAPAPAAPPDTWAGLGDGRPLWISRNRPGLVSDPAHPPDLAYCVPGAVRLSRDGGRSWSSVPTAGVIAATARTPYPVRASAGGAVPSCTAAVIGASHPRTAYAVFAAGPARYGMPPVYNVPLVTTDGGRRWRVVPPPAGFGPGGFGGFRAVGGEVLALFGPGGGTGGKAAEASPGVLATADGGRTWRPGRLACPGSGPCVAWGPAASGTGSCAMHAYAQPVEVSADAGRTWRPLPPAARSVLPLANGCGLNQLAALSATRVALVANGLPARGGALRVSDDAGATWHPVALPALPGGGSSRALQMLPSGALLAPVFVRLGGGAFGFRLELLRRGAAAWCTVPGVTPEGAGTDPATFQAAGGRVWWVQANARGARVPRSVPLSAVRC